MIKRELDRKFNGRIDAPNLYDSQETMSDQFICSTLSSMLALTFFRDTNTSLKFQPCKPWCLHDVIFSLLTCLRTLIFCLLTRMGCHVVQ